MAPLQIRLRLPADPSKGEKDPNHTPTTSDSGSDSSTHDDLSCPPLPYELQLPDFHLRIEHVAHPAVARLLSLAPLATICQDSWRSIAGLLYANSPGPVVRSVTVKFRPCGGVAATSGKFWDQEYHKKIVFSLDYLKHFQKSSDEDFVHEVMGVMVHELVHCCQYSNGAPGGFIEGIADYVRLRAGVPNKGWKKEGGKNPLAGYSTTGYFLDWIESTFEGAVEKLNGKLKEKEWKDEIFEEVTGVGLQELWENYKEVHELK